MRLVSSRTGFFGLVALVVAAVALPILSSGCGRSACFVYTKAEYDAHDGTCPAQAAALPNFSDSNCPGSVVSVDGPGIFNLNAATPTESLCCYPVTQRDIDQDFLNGECARGNGAGGVGGIGGGFGSAGITVGVGGGFMGCLTCDLLLDGVGTVTGPVCSSSVTTAWQMLQVCACDAATSACAKVCELNLCKDKKISEDCRACLETTSSSGCGAEFVDCQSN